MEQAKAEAVIEAVLFTMGESVEIGKLAELIGEDLRTTKKIIGKLQEKYAAADRGRKRRAEAAGCGGSCFTAALKRKHGSRFYRRALALAAGNTAPALPLRYQQ